MLAIYCLRQTTRRWIVHPCRLTLATLPSDKLDEKQVLSTSKTRTDQAVPLNDLLEVKRIHEEQIKANTFINNPIATSTDKFIDGLTPIQGTSSITPSNTGLIQHAEVSPTPVAPGIPVTVSRTLSPTEDERRQEPIPSSRFTAFLRSISSGLPFFPSSQSAASSIDLATTREYFIPLTRPSLIRLLATDSQFVDDEKDRHLFHQLCYGFDSAVVQRYQSVLSELKHLFDPLNPDNETLDNRRIAHRDRLDNEYWLLQKIDHLLHRANFTELSRDILLGKLLLHPGSSSSNIQVHLNAYDYDVLKLWILGREQIVNKDKSWWKTLLFRKAPSTSNDYFKRVIVAVRLRGQDRLYLKAFRDISLTNLPQLFPVGKLQLGSFERKLFGLSAILGSTTVFIHLISTMADYHLPGFFVGGTSLSLLLALWSARSFYQAKTNYLSSMNRTLFYKNIASNKQLLGMIVDRAEDELSKEVLLVYMFILLNQRRKIVLTSKNLELEIENWIRLHTNTHIAFNANQSLEFLRQLGILLPDNSSRPGALQVLPFKEVVGVLPKISRTLSEKNEEWDLVEGYDKKYFELDWKTVLTEDEFLNRGGWH